MADVTISSLSPLTPSTGLVLPVSNGTMPDGNYSICGSCNYDNVANTTGAVTFYVMNQTSSSCQVGMRGYNGVDYNCHSVSCQFFY